MASKQNMNPNEPASAYVPPGRLGDPNMKFFQEPRAHPSIVELFSSFGIDGSQGNPFADKSPAELSSHEQVAQNDTDMTAYYDVLPNDLPEDADEPEILQETRTFTSFDGVERNLYIFRPAAAARSQDVSLLPCVVYIHGGGMAIIKTTNKVHLRWCTSLAAQNTVSIAIDFRNAYTKESYNPFPTGLQDCCAAVQYIHAHASSLGISTITLQGESGGANLCLATALKAKQEGWISNIAGVYAYAPYISNGYGWSDARKLRELPSLFECDGYWLWHELMAGLSAYYSPKKEDAENALAWPYYATVEACRGLPPHFLVVDELDPLRDEGMAYYRKLLAAGVVVHAQVNLGTVHASALILRKLLPEVHNNAVRSIAAFAKGL